MPDLAVALIAVGLIASPAICTCVCAHYANRARRAALEAEGVVQHERQGIR